MRDLFTYDMSNATNPTCLLDIYTILKETLLNYPSATYRYYQCFRYSGMNTELKLFDERVLLKTFYWHCEKLAVLQSKNKELSDLEQLAQSTNASFKSRAGWCSVHHLIADIERIDKSIARNIFIDEVLANL